MKKRLITVLIALIIILLIGGFVFKNITIPSNQLNNNIVNNNIVVTAINLNDISTLTTYTKEEYEDFLTSYNYNQLPKVYVTEFLFDGVGMYKALDIDDFIEKGNDIEVEPLYVTVININSEGTYELSGKIENAMVAVNTNNLTGDIKILLNGVDINTNSKKVPAIYVYNKDIAYTDYKVTISTIKDTNNYIEGGKLKKISLVPIEEVNSYLTNYSSEYKSYTNYYGVYTSSEIENILFAKVKADNEDISEGDPYYFYKAAGAISSDIDLYFEGEGYLEVTSKNKEGIESKGNLELKGGSGDYKINAEDDCLNTTTSNSVLGARNTITIDVKSLKAIVSLEAEEGDAIDSNGKLFINGGDIVAIAKPGTDAGLDSESGTIISGGTIVATGDMFDYIDTSSTQNYISFNVSGVTGNVYALKDENENELASYTSDRTFTIIVFSTPELEDKTYYLYVNGVKNSESIVNQSYNIQGPGMMGPNPTGNPPIPPNDMR